MGWRPAAPPTTAGPRSAARCRQSLPPSSTLQRGRTGSATWTMTTTSTSTISFAPWPASLCPGGSSTTLESLPLQDHWTSSTEDSLHQVQFDSHLEPEALVFAYQGLLSSALKPSSSLCPGSRRWATPSDCQTTSPLATSWRPFLTSSSPPFPASTPTLSLCAPSSQRRWPTW